jgi:hypothetical protein
MAEVQRRRFSHLKMNLRYILSTRLHFVLFKLATFVLDQCEPLISRIHQSLVLLFSDIPMPSIGPNKTFDSSSKDDNSGSDWDESNGSLRCRILELEKPSEFPLKPERTKFLPGGQESRLISINTIREELKIPPADRMKYEALVEWINTEARHVFVAHILAEIDDTGRLKSLQRFKDKGVNDDSLHGHVTKCIDDKPEYFHAQVWKKNSYRKAFFDSCWKLWAPIFTADNVDYQLHERDIWPITKCSKEVKFGNFSRVYRVTIHKDHHTHGYDEVR